MHPRQQIIESMARTLIVTSFADWCEDPEDDDEDVGTARRTAKEQGYTASHGADWMNTTPEMSETCQYAAVIEAASLYGRIEQSWEMEPWIVVLHGFEGDEKERLDTWAHYAVMSSLGHGVCWEDSHKTLHLGNLEYRVGRSRDIRTCGADILIENFDWDWEDEVLSSVEG